MIENVAMNQLMLPDRLVARQIQAASLAIVYDRASPRAASGAGDADVSRAIPIRGVVRLASRCTAHHNLPSQGTLQTAKVSSDVKDAETNKRRPGHGALPELPL